MPNIGTKQLRKLILDAAGQISIEHRFGQPNGHISLLKMVELSGMPVPDDAKKQIQSRDDVVLTSTGTAEGVFSNSGPALEIPTSQATIIVPSEVKGKYTSTDDTFSFTFDANHTISGKKMMVKAGLESISASPNHVSIKVGGFLSSLLSKEIDLT